MQIMTYKEWQSHVINVFLEEHTQVTCGSCNGHGEEECNCDCPHCDNMVVCYACKGDKHEYIHKESNKRHHKPTISKLQYKKSVLRDLVAFSKHTGQNQLKQAKAFLANPIHYAGESSWK